MLLLFAALIALIANASASAIAITEGKLQAISSAGIAESTLE